MKKEEIYFHLNELYKRLIDIRKLPIEKRVHPTTNLIHYYNSNLNTEIAKTHPEVLKVKGLLEKELIDAKEAEEKYNQIYFALLKSRDILKHSQNEETNDLDELIEKIPCKASKETVKTILSSDEFSIDLFSRLYLTEHIDICSKQKLH